MDRLAGLRAELRAALRRAAPFLLSHHAAGERSSRCHAATVRGRRVHLCARCAGIYPGISVALLAAGSGVRVHVGTIAVLPAPAFLEWVLTGRGDRTGRNDVRTLTGLALGVGYGFGLAGLAAGRDRLAIVGVGLVYAAIAGGLLWTDVR